MKYRNQIVTVGDKIKSYRLARNFKQIDLGKLTGVDDSQIYNYEHNIFYPSLKNLDKLASVFKVDIKQLMDDYLLFITNNNYKNFFKQLKIKNNWQYKEIKNILGIHGIQYMHYMNGSKISKDVYIKLRNTLFRLKLINKLDIKR